jgi:hypothetical protein
MKTIQINLYKFSELSPEAQRNAIKNLSDINVDHGWWQGTYEDAENIGLKITSFELDRNKNAFGFFDLTTPQQAAKNIIANHGNDCSTYKTALRYYKSLHVGTENDIENAEHEFLFDLLEDYANILQQESEHLQSDKAIIETIEANDYDFLQNGKMLPHIETETTSAGTDLLDGAKLALRELREFYNDSESEAIQVLKLAINKYDQLL